MKLRWLLLSILSTLSILIFESPAVAGQLLSWKFDKDQNRLVFVTDEGVQPEAKLISNPTRLVIELPGTTLEQPTVKETYLGAIRGFRIGQSTEDKVNLVIELAPGYSIDPQQVRFRGSSSTNWTVELPSPKVGSLPPSRRPSRQATIPNRLSPPRSLATPPLRERPSSDPQPNLAQPNLENAGLGKIESPYVKSTSHGYVLDIPGDRSNQVSTTRQGNTIEMELQGITLPQDLVSQTVEVQDRGVETISFTQTDSSTAKITLQVEAGSRDWRGTFSRIRGFILVPAGSLTVVNRTRPTPSISRVNKPETNKKPDRQPRTEPARTKPTEIRAIALTNNASRLAIRSNGRINARSRFVGRGTYEVTLDRAKIGEPFVGPELKAGSPITELKVRETDTAVVLSITTKLGVRLGNIQQGSSLVALPIIKPRGAAIAASPPPVPAKDRPLIIIDPGHGGKDPGAIGIGGLQEKDVNFPISMDVAEELRKQNIDVRLTRDRDNFISLQGRTDFANELDADLFVSIHANAINLSRPEVNGLETYYFRSGRRLAEVIHANVLNTINIRDRKVRQARFFVLRHSKMPAVLVEVGFVTGAEDARRLKDPKHRRRMAKAIANGIIQYIKENRP